MMQTSGASFRSCAVKFTARKNRNAHQREVIRADHVQVDQILLARLRYVTFELGNRVTASRKPHRNVTFEARTFHSRNRFEPVGQLLEERGRFVIGIAVAAKIESREKHMICAKSRARRRRSPQAAHQQTRAREQHNRKNRFRDNQEIPQPILAGAAGRSAATVLE